MDFNFKNYNASDIAKLLANAATAFGVGFAQGGYIGGTIAAFFAVAALLQGAPAHASIPLDKNDPPFDKFD